ncbi:SAM-dependent DNA methyltransferase [Rhizobium laguerreae]|uniref:hypothetical protein n=1 Tax=Rhizobium laguerreae TaxID=1076926 RepID=UPI001C90EF57|nr:hypothetical protein [Rhizobium laguerreae]MBY3273692.1 SAM-dependent DNA methyltransferase [Rhizobium laguerreae]
MIQNYLATSLRRELEKAVKEARIVAESGASEAIRRLGITGAKSPSYLSEEEKELRRRLRAHARTLGDKLHNDSDEQEVKRLTEATAYAHWHRMLFARFLAERGLLRHPQHDVPVTLEDCREIAQEEGAADAWAVAERYAASMLPAVFRIDDPVLELMLDAAQNQKLHRLVTELDDEVFQAEDSLGWTYQFWRAAEKDAVNKRGDKIGADEISAVTQLFTEPYLVRFLLHNTLGAWWAGKVLSINPELARTAVDEDELRSACAISGYSFDMLRFLREGTVDDGRWRPAAGTFPNWPKDSSAITIIDPCCGSGHFLTEALTILVALRQTEEKLTAADGVASVLQENLHGLEIDGRCVQIAAFAVALTAWRIGGWQTLPLPHIAWVGSPPPLPRREFIALGSGNRELEGALAALHELFSHAPVLGSLITPTGGDLVDPQRVGHVEKLLEPLLAIARKAEPERSEGVIAARGMADAAALLGRSFTLSATNVPFLGRGKQTSDLAQYIEKLDKGSRADLATAMLSRILRLVSRGGTAATVTPQNWLFLGSYTEFRRNILEQNCINFIAVIGENGFESSAAAGAFTGLFVISAQRPQEDMTFASIDASDLPDPPSKSEGLRTDLVFERSQKSQLRNPDQRIVIGESQDLSLLSEYAGSFVGFQNGDSPKWLRHFWELDLRHSPKWNLCQMTNDVTSHFGGRDSVLKWENGRGEMAKDPTVYAKGREAWGKRGIIVRHMRELPAGLYFGDLYDQSSAVIVPKNESHLPAIWAYCSSPEFNDAVRKIDRAVKVTNATLVKVPFDFPRWSQVAAERYPDGLPEPYSDDPSQWLFHGHPAKAKKGTGLHIALSRLAGHRWPAETGAAVELAAEAKELVLKVATLPEGDQDGLLAVAGVAGEKPLADRLRADLAHAFGADWSDMLERRLVAEADEILDKKQSKDGSLEAWLRDRAFRQHCILFRQRPFLWHIWDGLRDGFSVFVHYHRFTEANLRKLTYTVLGDWLRRAKDESNELRYEKARELQQKLEKVLEGEAPFDIFVRWKPQAQQPLGWDPDFDDGVRVNIRPFIEAGILREQPKGIAWTKDRGNDAPSAPWYPIFKGERTNDHHTTLDEKRSARADNPEMVAAK